MRSSGTTRNPRRDRSFPLWVDIRGDDHPKACTGRRLLARGIVRRSPHPPPGPPIVLDPYAPIVFSAQDRLYAERHGFLVVDCSWNRLSERGSLGGTTVPPAHHRRLPLLLATNPQHFGRVGQLNTAEAFAAALAVSGQEAAARKLLDAFHGSAAFFHVNESRFRRYRGAKTPHEMLAAERAEFSPVG